MSQKSNATLVSILFACVACNGGDDGNGEKEQDPTKGGPALVLPDVEFQLEADRLLSSLTDEEIVSACEAMAGIMAAGDEGVACQIEASGSSDAQEECDDAREACLEDPTGALDQTSVRTTPAPINCEIFDATLTEGCQHTVGKLEDCANALAQSVVPAAQVVSCEEAGDFSSVQEANEAAKLAKATDFIAICEPLLQCEALVGALLTGEVPSGLGGAGGSR